MLASTIHSYDMSPRENQNASKVTYQSCMTAYIHAERQFELFLFLGDEINRECFSAHAFDWLIGLITPSGRNQSKSTCIYLILEKGMLR